MAIIVSVTIFFGVFFKGMDVRAEETETSQLTLEAKSYVLMEGSTGKIICERDKDKELMPASITKIMTLLLIFEALDEKKISMEKEVTVSEHAASMGGSQVFLEAGEIQTVKDMIKCITVSSANDACVAMAEFISGSEDAFVEKMNQRAKELGMEHTHFVNCCGLDDGVTEKEHYSTAYDIALMSRALIMNHPEITEFTTIWMDTIMHVTKRGEKEFGLSNTNKLVRTYNGITGLKTGSTSKAKYCLSATAQRNGMNMIAVVMAAPEPNSRFKEAAKLLDYGFANCKLYCDENKLLKGKKVDIKKGKKDVICVEPKGSFSYICTVGESADSIDKKMIWNEPIVAPIKKGAELGKIIYYYGEKKIGEISVVAVENVEKAKYTDYLREGVMDFFLLKGADD